MVGLAGMSASAGAWLMLVWRGIRRQLKWPPILFTFLVIPFHGGTTRPLLIIMFGCWGQAFWEALLQETKMKAIVGPTEYLHYYPRLHQWEMAIGHFWIGHCHLTHRYILAGEPQPYWNDCLVPLTVVHLLMECPSLGDLCHRFLAVCRSADDLTRWHWCSDGRLVSEDVAPLFF